MTPLEKFYTDDPRWHEKIGDIHALLERVKISEEQSGPVNVPVNVGHWVVIEGPQ
ncbi:hypothetical protein [Candidatus Amarolinea dominans]|uniref:hypothetical protein n=1 Tax=Candidatus Amarolinea dominans TaxID=3140696 RepID=UPI0031355049|nr:hypothetical protein [Anaerolineae bacterium]MBK9234320.1 hypothetical protein [Anaerolineae bacterium]